MILKFPFSRVIVGQILIILNISIFQTVLLSVVFGNYEWYVHQLLLVILNLIFICFNLNKLKIKKSFHLNDVLILSLSLIYLLEYPRFLFLPEGFDIRLTTLCFLGVITFWIVLKMLFQSRKEEASKYDYPDYYYINFSFLVLFSSVLIWALIFMGIIDYTDYPVPAGFSSYIDNNTAQLDSKYYAPLYLTIIEVSPKNIGLLSLFASFSGISYEPHIAMFFLAPSWFLLYQNQRFSRKFKILFNFLFIFFSFIAFSVTSFLALVCVYFLFSSTNIKRLIQIGLILSAIFLAINEFNLSESIGMDFFVDKIFSKGGSAEYSVNFLNYIFTPKSFFGFGLFNVPYPYTKYDDIGLLSTFLILIFFTVMLLFSLKRLNSKQKILNGVGLAGLYFIFHSMKIPQLIITMPFTVYILFLLNHSSSAQRRL